MLAVLGFVLGLSGPRLMARAFRHGLVLALRRQLTGAQVTEVTVAPVRPGDLARGVFRDVRIEGTGFMTKDGLRYDRFRFFSRFVRVDPAGLLWHKKLIWRDFGPTRLSVRINEASLTYWLRRRLPGLRPSVRLTPQTVRLKGTMRLRLTTLDFAAEGSLHRKTAAGLVYIPQRFRIGGFVLPEKWFQERLRPSLGSWEIPLKTPFPLRLSSFRVAQGYLTAEWREM